MGSPAIECGSQKSGAAMKARNPPHSVNELTFYFPPRNNRMGLPDAFIGGRSVDIFLVPTLVCADDVLTEPSWAFGFELGLCSLAWMRRDHIDRETGEIDSITCLGPDCYLIDLVRDLAALGSREYGVRECYFSVLESAIHHGVTAQGNPEQDGMIPGELDTLTDLEIERRLRAVLAAEQVPDLVFRKDAFQ